MCIGRILYWLPACVTILSNIRVDVIIHTQQRYKMGNSGSSKKVPDEPKVLNETQKHLRAEETVNAKIPNGEKTAIASDNVNSKDQSKRKGKKVVYSLNVILSCTEDGSKKERELGLKWIPETVAEVQDEIQEQFNIPVFDQKLMFGPTELSSKELLQSYTIRNGDSITLEYTTEADVAAILDIVSYLKKALAFIESVDSELILFPISPQLQARLRQDIDLTPIDRFSEVYRSSPPTKQVANSRLFINAGGMTVLQRLHSTLLKHPYKVMPLHVLLLESGINHIVWTLASNTETEAYVLKELMLDNIVRSLFRVTVVPDAAIIPPINPYMQQLGDIEMQVINNLLTMTTGCLSW